MALQSWTGGGRASRQRPSTTGDLAIASPIAVMSHPELHARARPTGLDVAEELAARGEALAVGRKDHVVGAEAGGFGRAPRNDVDDLEAELARQRAHDVLIDVDAELSV